MSSRAQRGIERFLEIIDALGSTDGNDPAPAPLLEELLERTGYIAELEAEHTIESRGAPGEPGRVGGRYRRIRNHA